MKNIWNIFRADWRRLTASVVAVVVLLGLCLVPCLYAWFNILSNWDPYGTASTSRISVAVASEDAGCEVLGLEVNIGALVLQGLESNDQMGWVFVDSRAEALDGVESGDYYAALIVPEEFTEDFVSILSGDLRHPQIQYYENEKKNAIAPKITSKAKTAVQEQINTTVIGKAAEALTTAGSVFKAMGLDSEALADGIMDKLTGARQEMAQLQQVLLSLKDVMNGADGLLTAASVTIADARGTVEDADAAAGSTVQLISTGLSAADTAYSDLLTVLNNTDKVLGDIEDALRGGVIYPIDIPLEVSQVLGFTHGERINALVVDAISASRGQDRICQSPQVGEAMAVLKEFMFANVYTNPIAKGEESKAQDMLKMLFGYYQKNPDELPADFQAIRLEEGVDRAVCDYIAGMTDPFAVSEYTRLFIPMGWGVK